MKNFFALALTTLPLAPWAQSLERTAALPTNDAAFQAVNTVSNRVNTLESQTRLQLESLNAQLAQLREFLNASTTTVTSGTVGGVSGTVGGTSTTVTLTSTTLLQLLPDCQPGQTVTMGADRTLTCSSGGSRIITGVCNGTTGDSNGRCLYDTNGGVFVTVIPNLPAGERIKGFWANGYRPPLGNPSGARAMLIAADVWSETETQVRMAQISWAPVVGNYVVGQPNLPFRWFALY